MTRRQLKAEVLSAAIDASSSPPYAAVTRIRRIGNPASKALPKTCSSGRTARSWTTISPWWTLPSKPQWFIRISRSRSAGTGQPARWVTPSEPAGTAVTRAPSSRFGAWKRGAGGGEVQDRAVAHRTTTAAGTRTVEVWRTGSR
ncbi:hypothetical protein OHA84_20610 [Streptomyces sp. NBC_00513]|uniref:hypothetical protein n=1 Tax=unclassified Streptomyces TaxID=2593676 RepID=UPI00225242CF|nr:hypothetical protein [Streptomyces sp. NBC_00424]MCX5074085.1 hypothetical protein [Streptomyces sp. NBC_00424]WUD42710.1 hypothetical protein OHA84_20610 [Streptomyces sp. NBC_00513]